MNTKRLFLLGMAVPLLVCWIVWAQGPPAKTPPAQPAAPKAAAPPPPAGPEKIRGTLVNQGGPLSRFFQAGYFQLQIDKYATDEEALALFTALKDGGQDLLLKKLWDLKQIGYVKVGGSMGYPIVFARSRQSEAGRIVRCLTNRPIAPAEFTRMSRSTDYPFGVIEIMFPAEGKGQGTLIPTAQVSLTASGTISVEAFGTIPVRLLDVTAESAKK